MRNNAALSIGNRHSAAAARCAGRLRAKKPATFLARCVPARDIRPFPALDFAPAVCDAADRLRGPLPATRVQPCVSRLHPTGLQTASRTWLAIAGEALEKPLRTSRRADRLLEPWPALLRHTGRPRLLLAADPREAN